MPNALAYLMLTVWPVVCLAFFRMLPAERAILWSLLGGYLLLPPLAEFDLPLVPDMDKYTIPSLAAFLACVLAAQKPVSLWPSFRLAQLMIVLFVVSVIPTVLTNREAQLFLDPEQSFIIPAITFDSPGLRWRDIGSVVTNQIIILLPFFMGRQYLSTESGLRSLLTVLMFGALAYTLPALLEIRFSPQLNIWIYGFFQHDFGQMIRNGGFRPIVFLPHALWLAFFLATAVMAAAALARAASGRDRIRFALAAAYLFAVLFLCKSLASLAYGLAFTPLVALASQRWQLRAALLLAAIAVFYPMLRNAGLVPTEAILAQTEAISAERTQSLAYRFDNEQILLERAADKPWFGWGGWGRNLIRHAETGEILSVPDGRWIIVFGQYGWLGYLAEMGLLSLPLALLAREARRGQISVFAAPVALILAATLVDMLINATLIPFTWLCAGAVLGHAERLRHGALERHRPALFGGRQATLENSRGGPRSHM